MESLRLMADMLCVAARTAPKAKGIDNIVTKILDDKEKIELALEMEKISKEYSHPGFLRDAKNIRESALVILIGTKINRLGLKFCTNCGYTNCEEASKHNSICSFGPGDLGIAVGSMVSRAMDLRLDNRIMNTAGVAAKRVGLIDPEYKIVYAVPLSITGKNPFFDR